MIYNIEQFAKLKNCSRQNIYEAERRGELEIDRNIGTPVLVLGNKNKSWLPRKQGRPRKSKQNPGTGKGVRK